jgi:hypothetical protein
MCGRLDGSGCEVLAVGRDPAVARSKHRFVAQDLNHARFAPPRGIASFDWVEGIGHARKPVRFWRNIPPLLAPGVAVTAAPNVDSLPAGFRVPLEGKPRYTLSDRAPIRAIFRDACGRAFRPPAGFAGDSVLGDKPILVRKAAR